MGIYCISAIYTCLLGTGILCLASCSSIGHLHEQSSVFLEVPEGCLCCALSVYWPCAQSIPPGRLCGVFIIPAVKAGTRVLKVRVNAFPLELLGKKSVTVFS